MTQPTLGQVVISRAGRDRGRPFLIVEVYDDRHVGLADGDLRRVEDPKKKNIRHVVLTNTVIPELAEKLQEGARVTNPEVYRTLEPYRVTGIKRE